jgi:hypothetical protein
MNGDTIVTKESIIAGPEQLGLPCPLILTHISGDGEAGRRRDT